MTCDVATELQEPQWLTLFRNRKPALEVATAWLEGLDADAQQEAKKDAPTARTKLRRAIVDSECPEVRSDAADGWKYTGSVMRAADEVLGVLPPKPRAIFQSSDGTLFRPKMVCEAKGQPGTLGLWWSDFDTALQAKRLREECGVTHRLNLAIEAVSKFSADDDEFVKTVHVPMIDQFSLEDGMCEDWPAQFEEILEILRGWREQGVIANINCQMGKNRSGAAVLLWLCCECGWSVDSAAAHLRSITPLALGNPHLMAAMSQLLKTDVQVPLNPGPDGGGWVCISPPGSPRAGHAQKFDNGLLGPDLSDAASRLASQSGSAEEEAEDDEPCSGEMTALFSGLDDVD